MHSINVIRPKIWRGFAVSTIGVLVASVISGLPASAVTGDLSDAETLVGAVAPFVFEDGAPGAPHVRIGAENAEIASRSTANLNKIFLSDIDVNRGEESVSALGMNLSIDYATTPISESTNFTVLETVHDNVAAYVQPTDTGVRVLTAIADSSAPDSYSYTFDVPQGSFISESANGYFVRGPDGGTLGHLDPAWAIDAAGKNVDSTYEWSGTKLTQHVDLSAPGLTYPILADPGWSYTHTYTLEHTTVGKVAALLQFTDCFDCYFPVEGAPSRFPAYNQFLPLVVRPWENSPQVWNYNCYMGGTYYQNLGGGEAYFGFDFMATKDHVDGEGSAIYFAFHPMWEQSNPSQKFGQLVVTGWVVDPTPMGYSQGFVTNMTWWNWLHFAQNVNISS